MAGIRTRLERAAATHRRGAATAAAAGRALPGYVPRARSATEERSVRELAERLRVAAALLAPGWLGAALDAVPATTPFGGATGPVLVRIGTAYPLDDASFPVLVPLGHLAFDGDARDARVAGTLRAVLLRLLATTPPGSLLVRPVDPAGVAFAPFAPLHDAGIMPPPVTDRRGLQALLTEAEQWVRDTGGARDGGGARDNGGARDGGVLPERTLLLVVASWPQETEAAELTRVAAIAAADPAAGVRLLVAGWPPPPLTGDSSAQSLPGATQVTLRNPYALVGHPPGGSFGSPVPPGEAASPGLNAQVYLDESPPAELVARVCGDLATRAASQARITLGELLPEDPLWSAPAADGLRVVVGRAGEAPVTVRLGQTTPHWLVVGRAGSGKTALLLAVLYGLSSHYGPDQLVLYLLDFSGDRTFADFVPSANDPSQLPHARAVGVDPDPQAGLAVLRGLARELARRAQTGLTLPRIVCMIDEVNGLLTSTTPPAQPAAELLASLARQGGPLGLHLILASERLPPAPVAAQCRVRIALPGGSAALDAANQAAAGLAVGTAVVNTASGLGGPRGATRAHEQLVRFPDPGADPVALAGLRHRLWRAGGARP